MDPLFTADGVDWVTKKNIAHDPLRSWGRCPIHHPRSLRGSKLRTHSKLHAVAEPESSRPDFCAGGILAHTRLLKNQAPLYGWAEEITQALEYLGCLLLFFFCTVETVDHFRWLQTVASERGIRYLHYMRDMALPAIWSLFVAPGCVRYQAKRHGHVPLRIWGLCRRRGWRGNPGNCLCTHREI